jgi:hypothetical protein
MGQAMVRTSPNLKRGLRCKSRFEPAYEVFGVIFEMQKRFQESFAFGLASLEGLLYNERHGCQTQETSR